MSTQDRIDKVRKLVQEVIEKEGRKFVSDGHCTFGVEYPAEAHGREPVYFSVLDLYTPRVFTAKTMDGVLDSVERFLKDKYRVV